MFRSRLYELIVIITTLPLQIKLQIMLHMTSNWTGVKPQGMDNPLKQAAVREAELASIRRELEEVLFLVNLLIMDS